MRVEVTEQPLAAIDADLHVIALAEGEELPEAYRRLPGADDVRAAFRKLGLLRTPEGQRLLAVGLGKPDELDAERLRVAAALALRQATSYEARRIAWQLPTSGDGDVSPEVRAAALVEGTELASYRFDRFKSRDPENPAPPEIADLVLAAGDRAEAVGDAAEGAMVVAEAANRARELQNLPANVATPAYLADRAQELADAHDSVSCEVLGRDQIIELGMGGLAAVAKGSAEEPRLITLRYDGPGAGGPTFGFVGKAVTFDSGGISIKPGNKMSEMKFDMSGGAAVLGATAAIARLGLPVRVIAVIGATENLPSGRSMKPGDILRARNGTTIEVINTDAEGRLVLADCLVHAVSQGAERLVDIATLTGAIVTTLGTTYAGLMGQDDEWCEEVTAAGRRAGEIVWRLPLHADYAELIKGRYGDILNAVENRRAASVTAAEFLRRFVGDVPWAHLDIAGTAWDTGKAYAAKGGTGYGVRLLTQLALAGAES